jgi:hypothetical protein
MPVDPYGGSYYDSYFRHDPPDDVPWYVDPLNRGLDVLGAWASDSPYVSPDNPRYRPSQTTVYAPQYPQQQQQQPSPSLQPYPPPGTQPPPKREGDITISSNMAMLLVGGVLLFMLGAKRGK